MSHTSHYRNSMEQLIDGSGLLNKPSKGTCLFLQDEIGYSPCALKKNKKGVYTLSPLVAVHAITAWNYADSFTDVQSIFANGFLSECDWVEFNAWAMKRSLDASAYDLRIGSPSEQKHTEGDQYYLEISRFELPEYRNIPCFDEGLEVPIRKVDAHTPLSMPEGAHGVLVRSALPNDIGLCVITYSSPSRCRIEEKTDFYQNMFRDTNVRVANVNQKPEMLIDN